MLKTFIFGLSFLAFSFSASAQWTLSPRITTQQFSDIVFSTPDTLYAAGGHGYLAMSIDTGKTWSNLNLGSSDHIMALASPQPQVVFAVGGQSEGKILKSTDGGQSWQTFSFPQTRYLMDIFFTSDSVGMAVGWNGLMLKTVNCGQTWFTSDPGAHDRYYSIHFVDQDTGYAVGINNTIVKTTNGGQQWSELSHNIFQGILLSVSFVSADTGLVVGGYGLMYRTTDGGNTWNPIFHGHGNYLQDIEFINQHEGYAVGELGTIMHTTDQGATWVTDTFGYFNPSNRYGWFGIASNNGKVLLAGFNGKIARPGCTTSHGVEQIVSCDPIIWRDSLFYDERNFTSTFMLPGAGSNGCDSLVILDYIRPLPATDLTVSGDTLISLNTSSFFQWVNCDSNYSPIPGAVNRYFIAPATGSYAVILTNVAGCSDTSQCVYKKVVSEQEHSLPKIELYPNPSNGQFNLGLNGLEAEKLSVYSSSGQLVYHSTQVYEGTYSLNLKRGLYLVQVQFEARTEVFRLVVE